MSLVKKFIIPVGKTGEVGRALSHIFDTIVDIIASNDVQIFVREKAFIAHFGDADRLFRVAGVSDVALWKVREKNFYDINPVSVKKAVTGNGHAPKENVAKCLMKYLGEQEYETDDESDAAAVGIAYLLREGYIVDPEAHDAV